MEKREKVGVSDIIIKNFKSVKSVKITDCRRINVLIGRPNVGKSNILEALSLFDVPYMVNTPHKSLKNLIRIENLSELFYNGDSADSVAIKVGDYSLIASRSANNGLTLEISYKEDISRYNFTSALTLQNKKQPLLYPSILVYFFPKYFVTDSSNMNFLLPPSGINLMETVAQLPDLKTRLAELFHGYGLKMMFDSGSRQIKAMRENGLDMFLVPFSSFADSLQRLIFYKTAIRSNHGKIICFEEPEAHTFPPYISNFVNDIIGSEDNQFFISTHSPYVMGSLLENCGDELAVYVVDMVDNQTVLHRLTDTELQQAYDNGIDMFYNIESYITPKDENNESKI